MPVVLEGRWHCLEHDVLDLGIRDFFSIMWHFAIILHHDSQSLVELSGGGVVIFEEGLDVFSLGVLIFECYKSFKPIILDCIEVVVGFVG